MPSENNKISYQKLMRMAALGFSVVFELTAVPFIGYFTGVYLVNKFALDQLWVFIGVLAGFVLGISAVMLTVVKLGRLN